MQKLSGLFLFAVLITGAFTASFAFAQVELTAEDDFYSVDEDSLLTINNPLGVLLNDTNTQSDIFLAINFTDVSFGTLVLNSDGSFTYQPNQDFDSTDSFTYVANNGTQNSNEATVTLSVNPINDAPIAQDDAAQTQQNVPIRIDVLENDSDVEDDPLNILLTVVPSETKGFVELDNSEVLFTPIADFVGETTFSYLASDGDKTSNPAQVTVTVTAVDEEPNDDSILDQILEQIKLFLDIVLNLEDEITQLQEENSALAMRITELESIVDNGIPTNYDTEVSSKKDLENQIKALKEEYKSQAKALKNDFKAQEKDLKKQLKDLKKDKKHDDDDDDD